jgi:hypothetical protein
LISTRIFGSKILNLYPAKFHYFLRGQHRKRLASEGSDLELVNGISISSEDNFLVSLETESESSLTFQRINSRESDFFSMIIRETYLLDTIELEASRLFPFPWTEMKYSSGIRKIDRGLMISHPHFVFFNPTENLSPVIIRNDRNLLKVDRSLPRTIYPHNIITIKRLDDDKRRTDYSEFIMYMENGDS